jgi:hypothetical protein
MRTAHTALKFSLTALAVSALISACGGGDATAPAGSQDSTAPTVTISDNVSAASASGDITFTFTFSEAVNGFTADDVQVTGGSKGAFNMASNGLSATLVVSPTAASAGTVVVTIASGTFSDAASNGNTASATASQAYDLRTGSVVSGETGTCTGATCITFSESTVGLVDFGGLGVAVVADPALASNKVAQLTKEATDETWAGATVHLGTSDFSVTAIDASAGITLRVNSPSVGAKTMVKIENAANSGVFVEAEALSTKAGEWETLTFSYPAASSAATYNKISVFPGFGSQVAGTWLIDELKTTAKTSSSSALTFASAFSGANSTTAEGGSFGGYSGGDKDGWNCANTNSFCGLGLNDAEGKDRLYYYYVAPAATTGLYSGVYIMAPGLTALGTSDASGLSVAGKTRFTFTAGQNPEWYASTDHNFGVLFNLSKVYSVGGGSNNCRVQLWQVVTPTSAADSAYSLNLSGFRVLQDCGTALDAATALSQQSIAQIDFKANAGGAKFGAPSGAAQEGANLSVANGDGLYPTTIVVKGPLRFE